MSLPEIKVGDEILIRAKVNRWVPGVGALVELFSKTDQYEAWVRESAITDVILADVPDEPADRTWLAGIEPGGTNTRVFIRNDAEGYCDDARRYDRHWWDVHAEEWVDWPEAVKRGADAMCRLSGIVPNRKERL